MLVRLGSEFNWLNVMNMPGMSFKCWNCNTVTGAHRGYAYGNPSPAPKGTITHRVYVCGNCNVPTFTDDAGSFFAPRAVELSPIENLPPDVNALYEELRATGSTDAPSLIMLGCRKMLMHVAVDRGAAGNQTFIEYVNHLDAAHVIPEGSRAWVDKLRGYGNETTHTINVVAKEEAQKALKFVEMLLRIVYEFPAAV